MNDLFAEKETKTIFVKRWTILALQFKSFQLTISRMKYIDNFLLDKST